MRIDFHSYLKNNMCTCYERVALKVLRLIEANYLGEKHYVEEDSKAIKEVAKTTGKAIDGAREFGKFIARYIEGSLDQGLGIFEDKLKYMRWERQVRLMQRAQQFLEERGLEGPTRAIPLSFAIPLFQAASIEEDDFLQDRWAALLVNAADASCDVHIRRSYISILNDLTPLDALILDKIYYASNLNGKDGFFTGHLPEEVTVDKPGDDFQPPLDIRLSLANLIRLGCLTSGGGFMGPPPGVDFSYVTLTAMGRAFVEACSIPRE